MQPVLYPWVEKQLGAKETFKRYVNVSAIQFYGAVSDAIIIADEASKVISTALRLLHYRE